MELTRKFIVGVCVIMVGMAMLGAVLGAQYSYTKAFNYYQRDYNRVIEALPPCQPNYHNEPYLGLNNSWLDELGNVS